MSRVSFEPTPNPATLKFHLYRTVTDTPFDVPTAADADRSPLASKIFGFPWTAGVYVGADFIAVTKHDWVDWKILAEPLANVIQEHLDLGEEVVSSAPSVASGSADDDANAGDSPLVRRIKEALNRDVRPIVALDGGDVVFAGFADGVLSLRMKGACAGCPSSSATLKQGIEVRMRELFPEVQEVVSV